MVVLLNLQAEERREPLEIGGRKFPLTTSCTLDLPVGYFWKKKTANGKRTECFFTLRFKKNIYCQRLLQILTGISEPLQQAFGSKDEGFSRRQRLASCQLCSVWAQTQSSIVALETILSAASLPLQSRKSRPYPFSHPKQPHYWRSLCKPF